MGLAELRSFLREERGRFVVEDNNLFAIAFADVVRYRRFLEIIEARYRQISNSYRANIDAWHARLFEKPGPRQLSDDEMADLEEREQIGVELHLEIESFYLFAKILLDEVGKVVQFYFPVAQKASLESHDKLVKNITSYAEQLALSLPSGFLSAAEALKAGISDYRDKQISHDKNMRIMRGTQYDPTGATRISAGHLYPKDSDVQVSSRPIEELAAELDGYLDLLVELIKGNRDRTRLQVET